MLLMLLSFFCSSDRKLALSFILWRRKHLERSTKANDTAFLRHHDNIFVLHHTYIRSPLPRHGRHPMIWYGTSAWSRWRLKGMALHLMEWPQNRGKTRIERGLMGVRGKINKLGGLWSLKNVKIKCNCFTHKGFYDLLLAAVGSCLSFSYARKQND